MSSKTNFIFVDIKYTITLKKETNTLGRKKGHKICHLLKLIFPSVLFKKVGRRRQECDQDSGSSCCGPVVIRASMRPSYQIRNSNDSKSRQKAN